MTLIKRDTQYATIRAAVKLARMLAQDDEEGWTYYPKMISVSRGYAIEVFDEDKISLGYL